MIARGREVRRRRFRSDLRCAIRFDIIVDSRRRQRPITPFSHCRTVTAARRREGKLADLTGPDLTDRWGVRCADLGASVIALDG